MEEKRQAGCPTYSMKQEVVVAADGHGDDVKGYLLEIVLLLALALVGLVLVQVLLLGACRPKAPKERRDPSSSKSFGPSIASSSTWAFFFFFFFFFFSSAVSAVKTG